MGIRIHTAIGYGMTAADFRKHCRLEAEDPFEATSDRIEHASPAELEIPKEEFQRAFYAPRPSQCYVTRALKAVEFVPFGKPKCYTSDHDPQHLFLTTYVFAPEEGVGHAIFFPSAHQGARWQRYNDDIDYAFERWRLGSTADIDVQMYDDIRFVAYGHHPWTNDVMTPDGQLVAWDGVNMLNRHSDLVPAPPPELRWWTKQLGILDDVGVNALRPIIAKWWC